MTKSEVLKRIDQELKKIQKSKFVLSEEEKFVLDFVNDNDLYNLEGMLGVTYNKATVAFIISMNEEVELENADEGYYLKNVDSEISEMGIAFVTNLKDINYGIMGFNMSMEKHNKSEKEQKFIFEHFLEKNFDLKLIKKCFRVIRDYSNNVLEKERQWNKSKKKQEKFYKNLKINFESGFRKKIIDDYTTMISGVTDEELRLEILKLIYQHNLVYQEEVFKEYQELDNDFVKYHLLLQKFGIVVSGDELKIIMERPYENVSRVLEVLREFRFIESKDILDIFHRTDINSVEELYALKTNGIITIDFIRDHKDLFLVDSKDRTMLQENIRMINEKRISPYSFSNSQDILLMDPTIFKRNVEVLVEYDFTSLMRDDVNYEFLGKDNLEILIDRILELGYESSLEENLNLLNYDINNWKRIDVLRELGIEVTDKKQLESILSSKNFIVPDETVDEYVYNAVSRKDQVSDVSISLGQLESLNNTKRTYRLGNIIISKNKVKRSLYDNNIKEDYIPLWVLTERMVVGDVDYQSIVTYLKK